MKRAPFSMDWLAEAQRAHGWSQEEVAEKLEVDVCTVHRWETGKCQPRPHLYRHLEALFDRGPESKQHPGTKPGGSAGVSAQTPPALVVVPPSFAAVRDTCTQFVARDLGLRLDCAMRSWSMCRGNARYHALLPLLMGEVERKDDNTMQENPTNRRNALRRLASVPIVLWGFTVVAPAVLKPFPFDDIITQCAAGLTALWYLRRGKDLSFVDGAVSRYIPTLEEMVKTGSGIQQQEAAELLAQSLLLKAVVIRHIQANHTAALGYQQQAQTVSSQLGNTALSIAILRAQAASYDYADNGKAAMLTAAKAAHIIETAEEGTPIPLTLQSFVYTGLANYQAHNGKKQEALTSLGKARSTFDVAIANNETPPAWTDHTEGNLLLNGGLAYYHLGMSQQAIDSFAGISQLEEMRETELTESFTDQVMAEVYREDKAPDMAFCIACWKQGIEGAIAMQSEQAFTESKVAYAAMRGAWPKEERIKALAAKIQHWKLSTNI